MLNPLSLLSNAKEAAIALVLGMAIGAYGHHVWDGYLDDHKEKTEVTAARTGETAIIKFNTDYSKVKANVKDKCADTAMPASLLKLQSK